MKRNGFTLVELLAVVVILALILAVTIPSITNIINDTNTKAFESNAKMILKALNYKVMVDASFDITTINANNIDTLLTANKVDYKSITVARVNNEPYIIVVGQNKWNNLVAAGTKNTIQTFRDLVLWLDAGNNISYPGTGGTWYDLSGNGNNCNWNAAPTYNAGGYFVFNGTSNFGTITNNSSLDFASSQTLFMILRHTYTTGRKNPWDQAYGGYGTWTHENGTYMTHFFGNAGTNNTPYVGLASPSTPTSVWNVLVSTRDTVEQHWYLNGVLRSTVANPYGVLANTALNIRIGTGYAGYWEGDMAAVLAFKRALSSAEIQQIYNVFKDRFGL